MEKRERGGISKNVIEEGEEKREIGQRREQGFLESSLEVYQEIEKLRELRRNERC